MPAELIAGRDGTYAYCPDHDPAWRSPPTDRTTAHDAANTHNLTNHMPPWLYGPEKPTQPRTPKDLK